MRTMTDTYYLTLRALRESVRQPAFEIQNVFIPFFFFAVTVGAIGGIAAGAFGVDNFTGFQMPVAVLQGVAGTAGWGGLATTTDIQRGYFDKLLLTPSPRLSLVLGRLTSDGIRSMILTTLIVIVGLFFGTGMKAGAPGVVAIIVLGGLFGLVYAGIGLAIALRTGSPQAAQAGFLLFFPLLFLSPAFAPKEVFSGWLEFMATINPVTYILEAMRELTLEGWSWRHFGGAIGCIAGMGAVTLSLTLAALRYRTS